MLLQRLRAAASLSVVLLLATERADTSLTATLAVALPEAACFMDRRKPSTNWERCGSTVRLSMLSTCGWRHTGQL